MEEYENFERSFEVDILLEKSFRKIFHARNKKKMVLREKEIARCGFQNLSETELQTKKLGFL